MQWISRTEYAMDQQDWVCNGSAGLGMQWISRTGYAMNQQDWVCIGSAGLGMQWISRTGYAMDFGSREYPKCAIYYLNEIFSGIVRRFRV